LIGCGDLEAIHSASEDHPLLEKCELN